MTTNKYSNHKVVWFHDKMESFANGTITAPIYVRLKPTNRCCHNCFYCVYNHEFSGMHDTMKRNDELSVGLLYELLDDMKEMGVKALTFTGGGEPLIHPHIVPVIERAKRNGLDLSIITNGQLLNGDRALSLTEAKWVRVSLDSCNEPMFEANRGVPGEKFREVIHNIEQFARLKSSWCNLSANFIINKLNAHSIVDAARLYKSLGLDNVRFSPVWVKNFSGYHESIKDIVLEGLSGARELQDDSFRVYDSYHIEEMAAARTYDRCWVMQTNPVIGANGTVYACHNKAYDESGAIGSVYECRFKDLWFSKGARKRFEGLDPSRVCGHQCAGDAKNQFIHQLLACKGDNFV
jgi:molybdenum cofactor biosynthesis enzyme MoaA